MLGQDPWHPKKKFNVKPFRKRGGSLKQGGIQWDQWSVCWWHLTLVFALWKEVDQMTSIYAMNKSIRGKLKHV